MCSEIVGRSAVGAEFEKLFQAVVDARIYNNNKTNTATAQLFSSLQKLEETLAFIKPCILHMDRPKEETEKLIRILQDGGKATRKFSDLISSSSCCNSCFKKWRYRNKIEALQDSLLKFFQAELMSGQIISWNSTEVLTIFGSNRFGMSNSNGGSGNYEILGSSEATDPPAFMVGLDVPLKELKRWVLLQDEESRIVVSAPGGCGKTTLAKRLCQDHQIKEYFRHNILYVTVSKTFDLVGIIKKLFGHGDEGVPEFQNEEDAVDQLELLVKKKVESDGSVLLVLDDVWCGSESALAKFGLQIPGYKVLVTSRNEFPGFAPTYKLKLLTGNDARTLFRHSAVLESRSGSFAPTEDLLDKIVRHCKGFPLALKVVGRSLHGQPLEVWRSTAMKLSGGQSILHYEDEVLKCLQSSLDALDENDVRLKECFMDLGSFPEDQKIPVTALADIWAESHKLDQDGVYAISNLHKLCSRNLLNLSVTRNEGIEGWYNDAFVRQHDLLRELAIYQNSQEPYEKRGRLIVDLTGNRRPEWWNKEKQPKLSARLVSISTDETFSSSNWYADMQIPEAKVLILNLNHSGKRYQLPEFMKQMDELKVLVLTNYGFCASELTNLSVLGSLSRLKRMRLEKVSIPTLSDTVMELTNLRKLSLVMCHKIGRAFSTGTMKIPETFPNLKEISIDYCNDMVELPKGFCDLPRLSKLCIANCHRLPALPEEIGKLANQLEVLRVRACTGVSKLPESIGSLQKLSVLDVTGCLKIKKMPKQIGKLQALRELYMRRCSGLRELPSSVTDLEDLERVICDEEIAQLWECFIHLLPKLRLSVPEETLDLDWL